MDRRAQLQLALLLLLPGAVAACDVYTPELLRGSGRIPAESGGTGDGPEAVGGTPGGGSSGGLGGVGTGGAPDGSGGVVPSGGDPSGGASGGMGSESTGGLGTGGSLASTGGATGETATGGIGGSSSDSGGLSTGGDSAGGDLGGGMEIGGGEAGGATGAAGTAPLAGAPSGGATAGDPPDGGTAGSPAPTGGALTGGAPSGGQGTGGTGSGGETTGGAPSGGVTSGGTGTGGLPAGITVIDLLDEANNAIELWNGGGLWYVFHDGSADGVITPDTPRDTTARVTPVALPAARDGSLLGVHVVANDGFVAWGAGVGFNLNSPDPSTRLPYDVSPYAGLVLWARVGTGTVTLRLKLVTADIAPDTEPGGECVEDCNDAFGAVLELTEAWQELSVPFSGLTQQGWGYAPPAGFDPTAVLAVQLHVDAGVAFDLWLDDVRFYE